MCICVALEPHQFHLHLEENYVVRILEICSLLFAFVQYNRDYRKLVMLEC